MQSATTESAKVAGRRPVIVAGNWKMNGTRSSVAALAEGLRSAVNASELVQVVVFPPSVFLNQVADTLDGSPVQWGAQTLSEHAQGAFTGEVSASMLKEFGCRYVLVGHSERRSLYGETDALVVAKFQAARASGLVPVLCVGETLEQRDAGRTLAVVGEQIAAVIDQLGIAAFDGAVIAYEPVWAIGTGLTATPEQAQEVHRAIRAQLAGQDASLAARTPLLYGGSVSAKNASDLFAMSDIDGGLVGGASLKAEEFLEICRAAEKSFIER